MPPNQVEPGPGYVSKEVWLAGPATLITTSGPRLHVRAHGGGYVDVSEATGEARFAAFESFVAGLRGCDGKLPATCKTATGASTRYRISVPRCPHRSASSASA